MRQAIFSDPAKKALLEGILHPLIALEVQRQITELDQAYCILVIPLYAESERYSWIKRVLVVDVAESIQIERVMARDQISKQQAMAILAAQSSRRDRLALADDVIDNSGSLAELQSQVEELHLKYLQLASSQKHHP